MVGTLLALALPVAAGPGPMQVEEPVLKGAQPPIQPDKDKDGWKAGKNASLSASQKAALAARQETMKDMVALIQQKRRAIQEARPEDRQALAKELHQLILVQSQSVDRNRHVVGPKDVPTPGDGDLDANARIRAEALDQKVRSQEHRQEILRQQEAQRRMIEEKLRILEQKIRNSGGKRDKDRD